MKNLLSFSLFVLILACIFSPCTFAGTITGQAYLYGATSNADIEVTLELITSPPLPVLNTLGLIALLIAVSILFFRKPKKKITALALMFFIAFFVIVSYANWLQFTGENGSYRYENTSANLEYILRFDKSGFMSNYFGPFFTDQNGDFNAPSITLYPNGFPTPLPSGTGSPTVTPSGPTPIPTATPEPMMDTTPQMGPALISGVIYDAKTLTGLANVQVQINPGKAAGETDENGIFKIETSDSGLLVLTASKEAYMTTSRKIEAVFGTEVCVETIYMQPQDTEIGTIPPGGGAAHNEDNTVEAIIPPGTFEEDVDVVLTRYETEDSLPYPMPDHIAFVTCTAWEFSYTKDRRLPKSQKRKVVGRAAILLRQHNDLGLLPGTHVPAACLSELNNQWEDMGFATVSLDSQWIEGWFQNTCTNHDFNCPWAFGMPTQAELTDAANDPSKKNDATTLNSCGNRNNSSIDYKTGQFGEQISLPVYQSLAQSRTLSLNYTSDNVLPSRVIDFVYEYTGNLADQVTFKIHAGETEHIVHYTDEQTENKILRYMWIAKNAESAIHPTGLYPYAVSFSKDYINEIGAADCWNCTPTPIGISAPNFRQVETIREGWLQVVNETGSLFGAGWGIQGVQRIFESDSGDVMVYSKGDGGAIYTYASEDSNYIYYSQESGEYTTLVRRVSDMHYIRTLLDTSKIEFNAAGYEVAYTDTNNNSIQLQWDVSGRLLTILDPIGRPTVFHYNDIARMVIITDPSGKSTVLAKNEVGDLIQLTLPDGSIISFDYDEQHLLVQKIVDGHATTYSYDRFGRIRSVALPDGSRKEFDPADTRYLMNDLPAGTGTQSNPATLPSSVPLKTLFTDANGNPGQFEMNAFGTMNRIEDALGHERTNTFDENGNVRIAVDFKGNSTTYTYDPNTGNPLTATLPGISIPWQYTYDPIYNKVTTITDPLLHKTTLEYDPANGNLVFIRDHLGFESAFSYDDQGRLERAVDPESRFVDYTYDPSSGNLLQITNELGHDTILSRDTAGNVINLEDAEHNNTVMEYDALNRLTRLINAEIGETNITYTQNGCVSCGSAALVENIEDALDHQTRFDYDSRSRLISKTNARDQAWSFSYDFNGNLTEVDAANAESVFYAYNELNLPVLTELSTGEIQIFDYDEKQDLTSFANAGTSGQLNYNERGWLTSATTWLNTSGAIEITSPLHIPENDHVYDGKDITVNGTTLTIDGSHAFLTLNIINGGVITHSQSSVTTEYRLDLQVTELTVDSASSIDVSEKGYGPGRTLGNITQNGATNGSGGSYGGRGGNNDPNPCYGDYRNPDELGSGGANGYGGGLVRIHAETIALNGAIKAIGGHGPWATASGGGICIHTNVISGSGVIHADGGPHEYAGGKGGGGRIAIYYNEISGFNVSNISAKGVLYDCTDKMLLSGGAGTIYLCRESDAHGDLIVDNQATVTNDYDTAIPSVNSGTITNLTASTLTDSSASFPMLNGHPLLIGSYLQPDVSKPDKFRIIDHSATTLTVDTSGGMLTDVAQPGDTYCGIHEFGYLTIKGDAHVECEDDVIVCFGSEGQAGSFEIDGHFKSLALDLTLLNPSQTSFINCTSGFIDSETIFANNILFDSSTIAFRKPLTVCDMQLMNSSTVRCLEGIIHTCPDLTLDGPVTLDTTSLHLTNLTLLNGAQLSHPATTTTEEFSLTVTADAITVDATSAIQADGKGYLATYTLGNSQQNNPDPNGSGSYGGLGAGPANSCYGDYRHPNELGTGGGTTVGAATGAGLIKILADTIQLNGRISCDAPVGTGGGGSGGGIEIQVGSLSGSGSIQATGGLRGGWGQGGGGGGGRIAIYYNDIFGFNLQNIHALGAGAGTIFLKGQVQQEGSLIIDNGDCDCLITPLLTVGSGTITGISESTLTDNSASFPVYNGYPQLVGLYLNPDISQDVYFRIVNNTATTITVDVTGGPPFLDSVADVGDAYMGEYHLDSLDVIRKANVTTSDSVHLLRGSIFYPDKFSLSGTLTIPELDLLDLDPVTTTISACQDATLNSAIIYQENVLMENSSIDLTAGFDCVSMAFDNSTVNLGNQMLATTVSLTSGSVILVPADMTSGVLTLSGVSVLTVEGDATIASCPAITGGSSATILGTPDLTCTDLFLNNGALALTELNLNSITLSNNAILSHPGCTTSAVYSLEIVSNTVSIDSSSRIDVSGKGYFTMRTLGNTAWTGTGRLGGSYGGKGGNNSNPCYGDYKNPNQPGSGGCGNAVGQNGYGGGLLRLSCQSMNLDGSIRANGNGASYGSGSGGGIYLDLDTLSGNGNITANGGNSHPYGSGGGGRIAIYFQDIFGFDLDSIQAFAGDHPPYIFAGAGTIYLKQYSTTYGNLIIDENDQDIYVGEFGTLPVSIGSGTITNLSLATLTDDAASFPMLNGIGLLPGYILNPDLTQTEVFTIVDNTETTITVETGLFNLTDVAAIGDTYAGIYHLDNVTISGKARVSMDDMLIVEDGNPTTFNDLCTNQYLSAYQIWVNGTQVCLKKQVPRYRSEVNTIPLDKLAKEEKHGHVTGDTLEIAAKDLQEETGFPTEEIRQILSEEKIHNDPGIDSENNENGLQILENINESEVQSHLFPVELIREEENQLPQTISNVEEKQPAVNEIDTPGNQPKTVRHSRAYEGLLEVAITYDYDDAGRMTEMTGPGGLSQYQYNEVNQLVTITNPGLNSTGYVYDDSGLILEIQYQNGVKMEFAYDQAARLTDLWHRHGAIEIEHYVYSYDDVGNVTQITENAGTHNYSYDDIYQLTTADHSGMIYPDEAYDYDLMGNRRPAVNLYDDCYRLLRDADFEYQYDENGNLVMKRDRNTLEETHYAWDSMDRLIRVNLPPSASASVVAFGYDCLDRRISKSVDGQATFYLYDGMDIIGEYDSTGALLATYTHGPGIDDIISITRGGTTYHYLKDHLGSVVALTDPAGAIVQTYKYDSFGNIVEQTGSVENSFTFTGREWDAQTGLYYYRARYYDPRIGRFIQEDPICGPAMLSNDINLYRYCLNNPVNLIDPSGIFDLPLGYGFRKEMKWRMRLNGNLERKIVDSGMNIDKNFIDCVGNEAFKELNNHTKFYWHIKQFSFDTAFWSMIPGGDEPGYGTDLVIRYKDKKYMATELNYIGQGLLAAHLGQSKEMLLYKIALWKTYSNFQFFASQATFEWALYGYDLYFKLKGK